jgi:predicted nucleic acid-binding protein
LGSVAEAVGPRVYLDTNFFIYALEEVEPWGKIARKILVALDARECVAVTSELTLAECLVKPLELGRSEVAEAYRDLLTDRPSLNVVPITREVLVEAARLRASTRIKLPDAIHSATALEGKCSSFLTNDDRLKIEGITVLRWNGLERALSEEVNPKP